MMDIEKLWFQAADECSHCPVDTRHRFAILVLEEAAQHLEKAGLYLEAREVSAISRQLSEGKNG